MSKILVTGGLGFIGHNVVSRLEKLGHTVLVADNRITYGIVPQDELDFLMEERLKKIHTEPYNIDIASHEIDWVVLNNEPDIIVHLASFPRQKVVNANPQLGSRIMSEGLLNMLEAGVRGGVKRFVYISSSMVYGTFTSPVYEDYECHPQGQYAIMKYAGELLVKDYTRRLGLAHTIIRPSAVYGPLDVEDRVVAKFMLQAIRGEALRVNGHNETLDFTYVDDIADGIVAAVTCDAAVNRTYNITRGFSHTLLDAAEMIISIVGRGTIEIRDRDPSFPSRSALNISSARRDLGYNPKVDIEEGFRKYYEWILGSEYWQKRLMT